METAILVRLRLFLPSRADADETGLSLQLGEGAGAEVAHAALHAADQAGEHIVGVAKARADRAERVRLLQANFPTVRTATLGFPISSSLPGGVTERARPL
jgi:hypothetical protein